MHHLPTRTTARETPDYIFELDDWGDGVVVHFIFKHFSPTTLKRAHREWRLFRQAVTCPLFAVGPPDEDDKWRRFVISFGFKPYSTVLCENGAERSLYIHRIDHGVFIPTDAINDGQPTVVGSAAVP